MDINSVSISGNLTRDAEMRYAQNGTAVSTFSIAHSHKKDAPASFFDCVMFGKGAEVLSQYLTKGKKVGLVGKLSQDTWEDNGQKRSKVKIIVNDVAIFSSNKPQSQFNDDVPF